MVDMEPADWLDQVDINLSGEFSKPGPKGLCDTQVIDSNIRMTDSHLLFDFRRLLAISSGGQTNDQTRSRRQDHGRRIHGCIQGVSLDDGILGH